MTATTERVVVIGVGNPWRRDDGAGPAVATALRPQLARSHPDAGCGRASVVRDGGEDRSVEVIELDGEAARLVDAWDGADVAVVVDAVRTGALPGTVHRIDIPSDPDGRGDVRQLPNATGRLRSAPQFADPIENTSPTDIANPPDIRARTSPNLHTDSASIGGRTGTSSHGLGVAQAVELGCVLGRLPRRLIVVGIEGADFGPGSNLTAAVAAAVEPAARLVAELIEGHPTASRGIGVAQAMDLATPASGLATDVVEGRT
jgi:hydrogenase maturation protease